MPSPRAYTANMDSIASVADAANASPDGLTVFYYPKDYGSVEGCKAAAVSFQQAFSALRSRARRLSERRLGEDATPPRDSFASGIYDKLVCRRSPLTDNAGWKIELIPARNVLSQMEIIDNATGLPLTTLGSHTDEWTKLLNKSIYQRADFTADDWDRFTELDEARRGDIEIWHTIDGVCHFPRPGQRAPSPLTTTPRADIVDLAALPSVFGVDGGKGDV